MTGRAVVTGATDGIGRACALALAEAGWEVVGMGRDLERGAALERASGGRVRFFPAALDSSDGLSEALPLAAGADAVVAAAGTSPDALLLDTADADWESCFALHLRATWAFARALRGRASGRVPVLIAFGSLSGEGAPANPAYAASKGAVAGLIAGLADAADLRAHLVIPGFVPTRMTTTLTDAALDGLVRACPLGRPGAPEEVAAAVVWLASPTCGLAPGSALRVAGGLLETPR